MRVLPTLTVVSLVSLMASVGSDAVAQPKKGAAPKAAPAKKPAVDIKPALEKLKSTDESVFKQGLDDVRIAGPAAAAAAPAIADALGRGLSLPTTTAAIETLGDLEAEAGSAAIAQYTVHRNGKLRRAAVKALTRTKGAAATTALKKALGDSDTAVRGIAASGLGSLKAKESVGDLFVALDHRVNEAAASIAILCTGEQCDKLTGKLGKLPFDVVGPGLDALLFRPTAEVSDDQKIHVIEKVRDLKTAEAAKFLKDVQGRWPKSSSPKVKASLDEAVKATASAGGTQ